MYKISTIRSWSLYMGFLKNDITDDDLEKLFDENNNSKFIDKKEEFIKDVISKELDVKQDSNTEIERPSVYQPNEVHEKKLEERKKQEKLLQCNQEELIQIKGNVNKQVFDEIAKARSKAKLEEYKHKIAKLPVIKPDAKLKLYSDKPHCTFHVYKCIQLIDQNHLMTSCKFCSESKIFSMEEWKQYSLENTKYL